jgi:P-type Ca2+ transporter type 2C
MAEEAPAATDGLGDSRSVAWHTLAPDDVGGRLGVEPGTGLSGAEAASRLASVGPNRFAEAEVEPRWHAFVRQYRDPMQIVLLVAGIGSLYPLKELGIGLALLFLTLSTPCSACARRARRPKWPRPEAGRPCSATAG